MSAVSVGEVRAGLVVHLDTDHLRTLGSCETNAEQGDIDDRAVRGPHYFLVLEVDDKLGRCVAVPLFSQWAPGSELLQDSLKAGYAGKWRGEDSYFSRWQQWRIPLQHIGSASGSEESEPGDRRTYNASTGELARILSWQGKNRNAFRAV
jgi:hypothetical protein